MEDEFSQSKNRIGPHSTIRIAHQVGKSRVETRYKRFQNAIQRFDALRQDAVVYSMTFTMYGRCRDGRGSDGLEREMIGGHSGSRLCA
jgi:hypothetical protein